MQRQDIFIENKYLVAVVKDENLTMNPAMQHTVDQFQTQFFFKDCEILTITCSEMLRLRELFEYNAPKKD